MSSMQPTVYHSCALAHNLLENFIRGLKFYPDNSRCTSVIALVSDSLVDRDDVGVLKASNSVSGVYTLAFGAVVVYVVLERRTTLEYVHGVLVGGFGALSTNSCRHRLTIHHTREIYHRGVAAYRLHPLVVGFVDQCLLLPRAMLEIVVLAPEPAKVIVHLYDIDAWMRWVTQVGGMRVYLAQPLVLVFDVAVVARTHPFHLDLGFALSYN